MTPLLRTALAPLVVAARAGDLAAFAALVEATQQMAMAVAFQVMRGDEAEARDAVQDACLAAFRRLPELARPEAFAGWLRRIVVTTALNRRRARRRDWPPARPTASTARPPSTCRPSTSSRSSSSTSAARSIAGRWRAASSTPSTGRCRAPRCA